MPTYKYTGTGIMAFWVEGKRYEIGIHPRLSTEVELPKKVKIAGLEEVTTKRKSKENDKGDE
jgi:hypothetical protein